MILIASAAAATAAPPSESRKEWWRSSIAWRLRGLRVVPDDPAITRHDFTRDNFCGRAICYTQENLSWLRFLLRIENENDARTLDNPFRCRKLDFLCRIPLLSWS